MTAAMTDRRLFTRKLDLARGTVDLSHGSGGKAMAQLVRELFAAAFANPLLDQGNDQAAFDPPAGRMVVTTDGFVVSPVTMDTPASRAAPAMLSTSRLRSASGKPSSRMKPAVR